ncbi:MAG: 50S ribosomal protein L17 [Akkermansia sp.]
MRHGVKKPKLQRTASHRKALLANQACSLISNGRITTTLAKAKALRPYVEKLITLGKNGSLHARRQALATLPQPKVVAKLFGEVATATATRQGGYTRIVKLGQRKTDSAPMALIEIIDLHSGPVAPAPVATSTSVPPTEAPAAPAAEAPAAEAPAATETPTEQA